MTNVIANKYIIHEKIGGGCFGSVYKGINHKTQIQVAIKMEDANADVKILKNETTIMKYLYDKGSRDIPIVYWFGVHNNISCLVMSLYDCSLYDYIQTKPLSENKINTIMVSLINSLQFIHTHLIVHRDIKPQNIMLRNGELFLIDFGFATFYVDENSNHIVDDGTRQHIIGTPKYVSFHVHCGYLPTRRDDLISLGYMYMYLHRRSLPWDILPTPDKADSEYEETHILNFKNKHRGWLKRIDYIQPICLEINKSIEIFLKYCYYIHYNDTPNYTSLSSLFMPPCNRET
jgi:serine/threonine protein kinase